MSEGELGKPHRQFVINVPTKETENDHNNKSITETWFNKQTTGLANINTKLVAGRNKRTAV